MGLICGLLAASTVWLVTRPPRGQMVRLLPPPTASPLIVHVSGAVVHPGVYTLPAGSRVKDAIVAAGDVLPGANPNALNLAAALEDGAKVEVPLLMPPTATVIAPPQVSSQPLSIGPININLATQAELESLPGIGPVIAARIIAYREENGSFGSPEAIQKVSGIGPATFERIRELITVNALP